MDVVKRVLVGGVDVVKRVLVGRVDVVKLTWRISEEN